MTRRNATKAARTQKSSVLTELPPVTKPLSWDELSEKILEVLPNSDKGKVRKKYSDLAKISGELYDLGEFDLASQALTRAYVSKGGFYHFSKDIVGFKDLDPVFHPQMVDFIAGEGKNDFPFRLLLAFRGSFKSSLTSIAYPAYRIAQSWVENEGECPIRIGIACERMPLATALCRGTRMVVSSPRFLERFGMHQPAGKRDWSNTSFTSAFQPSFGGIKDPTVFTIALGAERTGFHFDLIIADDIQAYASAFSDDQLDKSWELYSLLHSLLDPGGELVLAGTRWHYDDIYNRIMKIAEKSVAKDAAAKHFISLVMPSEVDDEPTFPSRFPKSVLAEKKAHSGTFVYSCQYLMDPLPEGTKRFAPSDMRYRTEDSDSRLAERGHWFLMGVDPAWVSEERIRAGDADSKAHSVVVTMAMDAGWNWYVWDIFREQCGRMQLVQEIFRQYKECVINGVHQPPIGIGFQVVDRKYLQEELDRQSFQQGMTLPWYWLSHWDQEGSINKKKRIEGALEGLIRSHKFFIPRGLEWLEDELFQFPRSRTMDGMDAVVNAIKTAPHAPRELQGPITPLDQTSKHIDDLLAGKLRRRKKRWVNAY